MDFPEEVIVEILSWLPAKSLTRFKCVSKPWLQLLSTDPRFIKLHFTRSIQPNNNNNNNSNLNPGVIICQQDSNHQFHHVEDITAYDNPITFKPPISNPNDPRSNFQFVNVCNGLVCIADGFVDYNKSRIYIWNPITGDHVAIPYPSIPSHFFEDMFGVDFMFGFGYNQISDEYKVVFSVSTSPTPIGWVGDQDSHVCVYTLGTGSWRTLQGLPLYHLSNDINCSTAFVNGALHWFAYTLKPTDLGRQTIVAFDIEDECFEEIPQPDGVSFRYPYENFVGELYGLLCITSRFPDKYFEVWVMEDYGVVNSWRRLWKIVDGPVESPYYLTLIGVAGSGEIIIGKNPWEWIAYDPKTNSLRDLPRFEFKSFDSHTFEGSLLSPTIIDGANNTSQQNQPHD